MIRRMLSIATLIAAAACADAANYDVLISGGTVYDGSGAAPFVGDVAINGDRVVAVGDLSAATAESVVDATGLAVSPGFVNMLSWATESLIVDGRSQGRLAFRPKADRNRLCGGGSAGRRSGITSRGF